MSTMEGLSLWDRVTALENSEIGVNGVRTSGAFSPLKSEDGLSITANGQYKDYAYTFTSAGTIQLTYRPHFASTSTTLARLFGQTTGGPTRMLAFWNTSSQIQVAFVGGPGVAVTPPSFSANDVIDIAFVWDTAGIGGGADTLRIYWNNVDIGSDTTAITALTQTTFRLGNESVNDFHGNAIFGDLKISAVAITDFSNSINVQGFGGAKRRS